MNWQPFSSFDRYKPHQRTRHSLADGCRIGGIILGPLNVALHVARRRNLHRVPSGDVQVERRRSLGVADRRAHQARQPLARLPHQRPDALGLRKTILKPCQRGAAGPLTTFL